MDCEILFKHIFEFLKSFLSCGERKIKLSFEERFPYFYILRRYCSLKVHLKIVLKTIIRVWSVRCFRANTAATISWRKALKAKILLLLFLLSSFSIFSRIVIVNSEKTSFFKLKINFVNLSIQKTGNLKQCYIFK